MPQLLSPYRRHAKQLKLVACRYTLAAKDLGSSSESEEVEQPAKANGSRGTSLHSAVYPSPTLNQSVDVCSSSGLFMSAKLRLGACL